MSFSKTPFDIPPHVLVVTGDDRALNTNLVTLLKPLSDDYIVINASTVAIVTNHPIDLINDILGKAIPGVNFLISDITSSFAAKFDTTFANWFSKYTNLTQVG